MPSIVDPERSRNGASTLTRGLLAILREPPLEARVELLAPPVFEGRRQTLRQATSLLRGFASGLPAKLEYTRTRLLRRRVRRVARAVPGADLAIFNGADVLWAERWLPPELPRIIVAHNLEQEVFAAQIRRAPQSPGLQRLLQRDLRRLRRIELEAFGRAAGVLFVSPDELALIRAKLPTLRPLCLPPVFDYAPGQRAPRPTPGPLLELGFLGNLAWWPNREGLAWFASKALPALAGRVRLHVFGPCSERLAPRHPAIETHGSVRDLSAAWETCDLFINPVRVGAGVSIKTAETFYNGAPQLVTSHGARGLALDGEPAVKVLDQPAEWVAWLRSEAAAKLATERPRVSAQERFSAAYNRSRVQAFIAASARPAGQRTR